MTESNPRPVVDVACGLIVDDRGRLLAALRPEGKSQAGLWEFPGGKLEPGEDAAAALVRELVEELGCHVRTHGTLPAVEHDYPAIRIRLHPVLASIVDGVPRPLEHAALEWIAPDEPLSARPWAPADIPVIALWRAHRDAQDGAGR